MFSDFFNFIWCGRTRLTAMATGGKPKGESVGEPGENPGWELARAKLDGADEVSSLEEDEEDEEDEGNTVS